MKKFDVALSYAKENEKLVKEVYKLLVQEGFKVFFAPEYQHRLIGKDIVKEFYEIYRYESVYIAAFISKYYIKKEVPMREAYSALMKNSEENKFCLMPFYLDDTALPRLDNDIIYSRKTEPIEIVSLIKRRILEEGKIDESDSKKQTTVTDYTINNGIMIGNINARDNLQIKNNSKN